MPRVELPWPPQAASANAKNKNWCSKYQAGKSYKNDCAYELMRQGVKELEAEPEWLEMTVTFHPPRNGRLDPDNSANRIKSGLDALAEALGVDDSKFWPMHLHKGSKVTGGLVVIEWKEKKDE